MALAIRYLPKDEPVVLPTPSTREEYFEALANPAYLEHAITIVHSHQTAQEQTTECTVEQNGTGWNGADAYIMSEFAMWIARGRHLSPKQTALALKKMRKYSRQVIG
jgi:hypothetical protein